MRKYFVTNTIMICCSSYTYEEAQTKVREYLQDSPGSVFFICEIKTKCFLAVKPLGEPDAGNRYVLYSTVVEKAPEGESK